MAVADTSQCTAVDAVFSAVAPLEPSLGGVECLSPVGNAPVQRSEDIAGVA